MTIGASFLVKKLDFEGGIKVRLQIWDTAGQERFRSMVSIEKQLGGVSSS